MNTDLASIIESLLFVSEGPLTVDQIRQALIATDPKLIRETLAELEQYHDAREGGFYLAQVAGGYQFRTRPECGEYIRRLMKPPATRLSKAALETLAIIAYKQPLIRADIETIRGVDCGGVLRMLLDRKLVRILGRKEIPGRPMIYATTKKFLEMFGMKDLKDLPSPQEIAAYSESDEFDEQRSEEFVGGATPIPELSQRDALLPDAPAAPPSDETAPVTDPAESDEPEPDEAQPHVAIREETHTGVPEPPQPDNMDSVPQSRIDVDEGEKNLT